ncbi:hypothetical protein C8J56DRAFT_971436 [Mycena floridula]|nr:hypothetical protein C8J56DRAFT_971436 [Mycena floridula]
MLIARYSPGGAMLTPEEKASGNQAVERSSVSALALLLYDILLSSDEEVQLIWPKPLSLTKLLYFFVRYCPLLVQISVLFVGTDLSPQFHFTPHDCYIWQAYQGAANLCIAIAVDYILILRVFALYLDNTVIRWVIGISWFGELFAMALGLGLAVPKITYDDICLTNYIPETIGIYGGAAVAFQSLLFGLTLYKFWRGIRQGLGRSDVVSLLMRDGTWAFFLLFFLLAGQGSLAFLKNTSMISILYGWSLTGFSFAGYRVLLNLHGLSIPSSTVDSGGSLEFSSVAHPISDVASYEMSPLSSIALSPKFSGAHSPLSSLPAASSALSSIAMTPLSSIEVTPISEVIASPLSSVALQSTLASAAV